MISRYWMMLCAVSRKKQVTTLSKRCASLGALYTSTKSPALMRMRPQSPMLAPGSTSGMCACSGRSAGLRGAAHATQLMAVSPRESYHEQD